MKQSVLVSIGFIAGRTGSTVSAVRFYADQNMIPSTRNQSGHRVFHRSVIRRVSFILIAQNLGYSLKQIAALLAKLPDRRTPTKRDWEILSQDFNLDLQKRIDALTKLQNTLSTCIGCGCLSLENCELYNASDQAFEYGSGARYLLGNEPPKNQ
jgi:MerR family redox-sensitive transcriptional activator SoxR